MTRTTSSSPPNLLFFVCLLAAAVAVTVLQASSNLRWLLPPWSPYMYASSSSSSSSSLLESSRHLSNPSLRSRSNRPMMTAATATHANVIAPGELPGYTGWARPERTSAGHFAMVGCSSCPSSSVTSTWLSFGGSSIDDNDKEYPQWQQEFVATAGQEFHVDVRCSHVSCIGKGNASTEFYLRAYGPSVLTGISKRLDDTEDGDGDVDVPARTYRLSYHPLDAGSYTVEAVVAYSSPPPMESFPLGGNGDGENDGDSGDQEEEEPGYEGHLLRGFPLQLEVLPSSSAAGGLVDHLRTCTIDQLPTYGSGSEAVEDASILEKGRWVVTEKVRDPNYMEHTAGPHHASLDGYQHGYNSLGIKMEYQPVGCKLADLSGTDDCLDQLLGNDGGSNIHFIFVGDSVMGLQHRRIRLALEEKATMGYGAKASLIGTHGGLAKRLDGVIEELQEIAADNPKERRVVLFNAGLHDIAQLCSTKYKNARADYFPLADDEFSCVEVYKTLLHELALFLAGYPAEFVAFQTTSAGWMPYGNFGFAWKPNEYQPYSLSPNAVAHFNQAAMTTIAEASGGRFLIVDGYYITLARPDHREIGEDNAIGKHMVHPGVEVVDAMAKIWLTIVTNIFTKK